MLVEWMNERSFRTACIDVDAACQVGGTACSGKLRGLQLRVMQAQTLRGMFIAILFAVLSLALLGASCDKKESNGPETVPLPPDPDEAPLAAQKPSGSTENAVHEDGTPKLDLSRLHMGGKERYARLLETLPSPCGKAHSLKMSVDKDEGCLRRKFAAAYVIGRLEQDFSDDEIEAMYQARYLDPKRHEFDLSDTPFSGVPNAPVVLVEFFDYGCPHCKEFKPMLDELLGQFSADTVLYYKFFPLSSNPNGIPAARAAIAAMRQGKFHDMQDLLLKNQMRQANEDLFLYAKSLGLDMTRFEADLRDPKTRERVARDREDGEGADVMGTPSLYINGRNYTDQLSLPELASWVREELYVNQ